MLSDSMNTMIDKINELLEQVKTEQVRLRKAEFELLQSQINPHFLYNTLDAIVWLAEAGEQKKVVSMVGSLSDFFRISLNQGQDILDVREELQHVRSYLEIQQMRYQDILQYEICVPEELYSSRDTQDHIASRWWKMQIVLSIFCLRIPIVVVSANIIFSRVLIFSSLQITVISHPGLFFFIKTGM